jgi:hypothetical protein
MSRRWGIVLAAVVAAGCVSIADQHPTRPPRGQSAADVARDQTQCETYARAQPEDKTDHYRHCMVARGHART